MPVPFPKLEDIIYCHNDEIADELLEFLQMKGYTVGKSISQIITGTHGEQVVKRLDVFKKRK